MQPITVDALLARYRVILLDAYGVLVHGTGAMPGAPEFIARLQAEGHQFFVLTNDASKLPETASRRYSEAGVAVAPERIVTSGGLLTAFFRQRHLVGSRCAVLGPEDTLQYVERAGGCIVPCDQPFDVLVCGDEAGYPFLETVEKVLNSLFRSLQAGREVVLVLPNPDLIFPKAHDEFGIAAGSIAVMIEAVLRRRFPRRAPGFIHLGKPEPDLFREALGRAGEGPAVMIGDQLETDIHGARRAGLDTALVTTGVSLVEDVPEAMRPTYLLSGFSS